jgi:hypothetical protein
VSINVVHTAKQVARIKEALRAFALRRAGWM